MCGLRIDKVYKKSFRVLVKKKIRVEALVMVIINFEGDEMVSTLNGRGSYFYA